MRRHRILSACVAASLLMLTGSVALAQPTYYELYDQALAHMAQAQKLGGAQAKAEWDQAETKLKQALKIRRPGRNVVRYGMLRADFLPDFYLGIVYRNTGRPDEALASFKATQSLIGARDKESAQLASEMRLAQAAIDAIAIAKGKEKPSPPTVPTGDVRLPSPGDNPTAPPDPRPERFKTLMTQARSDVKQRRYREAEANAGEARKLNIDNAQADDVIRQARTNPLAEEVERVLGTRNPAGVQQAIDALAAVDKNDSRLAAYRTQLQTLTSGILIARAEREAMRLYFVGNYQGSLKALQQAEQQGASSDRLRFYRACSLAALALSDPRDNSRMAQARAEYKQVPPGTLDADRRFISPKILRALVGAS